MTKSQIETLSDQLLLDQTALSAAQERASVAELIALFEAVDARGLYKGLGCPSMFTYCTTVLHMAEGAAYLRIGAARASRRFPVVLERLATGEINLSTLDLLVPHLTEANHLTLLDAARYLSKRDVQQVVAALRPQPDVEFTMRTLPSTVPKMELSTSRSASIEAPTPITAVQPAAPTPSKAAVVPLAPKRFLLKVTLGQETHDTLERLRALMRHSIPDGDPAQILDRALRLLLTQIERTKAAATDRPRLATSPDRDGRTRSRHVPAVVRRAVWSRDNGQCSFIGTMGRCAEKAFLEFHHVVPFADGGPTTVENLELRCRSHNAHEARLNCEAQAG